EAQGRPAQGKSHIRRTQVLISCTGLLLAILFITPVAFATPAYQATAQFQLARQQAATGQPVDGLRCEPTVGSQSHLSIHLSVYVNNEALALPAGIGIVAPPQPGVVAFASHGRTNCLYPLHVYENDNIIHAELFDNRTCYLGQFFDIWGQPLSRTQISGYRATVDQPLVFEIFDASGNEHIYSGDPRKISLEEHETIVVLLHSPLVHPAPFIDWNGL
ncbi:MAG TPA: hypothetical protein VKU38_14735, partial [Ktedonobacteraceae bacterium]|nr:hypothetical protein [Ktedonobacteraceae bacterium]